MEPAKIEYVVRQDKTTEVISSSPIELADVPCWTVTRMTAGSGWHIGKYKSKKAAQLAAGLLATLATEEFS